MATTGCTNSRQPKNIIYLRNCVDIVVKKIMEPITGTLSTFIQTVFCETSTQKSNWYIATSHGRAACPINKVNFSYKGSLANIDTQTKYGSSGRYIMFKSIQCAYSISYENSVILLDFTQNKKEIYNNDG